MARAAAIWGNTVIADWQAGDLVPETKWLEQVLQSLEHVAQTHNHDVDTANSGGALVLDNSEEILLRM